MAEEKETDNQFDFPYFIENYPLTEDFLLKMEQIVKEYENLPPELINILKNNNITPKDFHLGCNAIVITLGTLAWNLEFDKKNGVFLSNLEFGKKHMDRISIVTRKICNDPTLKN
ncbi:hypothetical protein [Bartonella sp. MU37NMGALS]|uniref:hypothetical protein n=1 Tax=Bartonella sp. MU37NMGALS TaxID=3243560 RepID=UPI0035D0E75F